MIQEQADSGHYLHTEERRECAPFLLLQGPDHLHNLEAHRGPSGVFCGSDSYSCDPEA